MTRTITIRSRRGQIATGIIAGFGAAFVAVSVASDGWLVALYSMTWPLAVVAFSAWLWMWPRLVIAPGGVMVRNMFRTVFLPWDELTEARSNLGLYLWAGERKFFSSAPPARGGVARGMRRQRSPVPNLDDTERIHHVIDVDPATAADLITAEIDAHRHPDRREVPSTRDLERIRHNLEAHPIPEALSTGFPRTTTIRWVPWPAVGFAALTGLAMVATMAL